jgi:CRP-like cAMP-binding protein
MSDFWRLHGLDWLSGLSDAETERILGASSTRDHARGETIFEPALHPRSVYLLERGLVRIYRLSALGDEATLGYVRPGEVFGELGAFSDQPRESFASAVSTSHVWRIPRAELRRVLDSHPRIALCVTAQIGNRFRRIESRVENLVLHNLRSRIAHILLELAEDFGRDEAGARLIDLPLSQQDIAMLVGATRQSVNVCLCELRASALVAYRSKRLALPDPAALRRAAELVPTNLTVSARSTPSSLAGSAPP